MSNASPHTTARRRPSHRAAMIGSRPVRTWMPGTYPRGGRHRAVESTPSAYRVRALILARMDGLECADRLAETASHLEGAA